MARGEPLIRIVNQPINRMRFRYGSEKGSHGTLTGKDSTHKQKTFPSVQLENYFENKTVYVKATLYNSDPLVQHVHRLKGPDCKDGICIKTVDKTNFVVFQNLSIEFVGKRELKNIIYERKQKELQFPLCDVDIEKCVEESKRINLHVVRICFEAGVFEGGQWQLLCKEYSDPISNQKSTDTGELKITRVDKYSGSCKGGDEVFLLCERVNKKDIKIKFFEEEEGKSIWEAEAYFTDSDVHHQVAIVFKTPPYRCIDIKQSVKVAIQLFRPSDNETSKPIPFEYEPALQETSFESLKKKRKTFHTDCQQLEAFTLLSPMPSNITSVSNEDDKGNSSKCGDKRNSEKSVLSCNPNYINKSKKQCSLNITGNVADISKSTIEREESNFQPSQHVINNNYQNTLIDFTEWLSAVSVEDTSLQFYDKRENSSLIEHSRDPVLGSTSSFYNSPPVVNVNSVYDLYSDSISKEAVLDSLEDRLSKLSLKENEFYRFTLIVLNAFQNFIITGDIYYIFLPMRLLFKIPDLDGNNVLHLVMIHQSENVELLKCILKVAKTIPNDIINQVNHFKQTLLHLAVKSSCTPTINILLEAGCNPNFKDKDGNTIVHYAVFYDHTNCLKELITFQKKYKIDFNLLNFEGLSPLHIAVKSGKFEVVKLLCLSDININATDGTTGRTPLHYAVQFCPALVKTLLNQSGIIIDPKDYAENTPLHLAYSRKLEDLISVLGCENIIPEMKSDDESDESSYSSDDEKIYSDHMKNIVNECTDKSEDLNNSDISVDCGYKSREITFLDNSELEKMCLLLDPPNEGWKDLAIFLVDEHFIQIAGKYKSPTKLLLRGFEGGREDLERLLEAGGLDNVRRILG